MPAENTQETGLFSEFAELFSVTIVEQAAEAPGAGDVSIALPGGNELPEVTGKNLPVAAADLPVTKGAHLLIPNEVTETVRTSSVPIPSRPDQPHLPEAALVSTPTREAETRQTEGKHAALVQALATQTEAGAKSPAKPFAAPSVAEIDSDAPTITVQFPTAKADTPVATEQAARLMPVAQLLRPMPSQQTSAPDTGTGEIGLDAASEAQPQRASAVAPASQSTAAANQPATPAVPVVDVVRPVSAPVDAGPAPGTQRHDFGQVVERLAEARELARPGRAEMQVSHREFGQVSMQFDVTGGALKVALASAHVGFAPAVQAALAERSVTPPGEAARVDVATQQLAQTSVQASASAQGSTSQFQGDTQHQQNGRHPEPQRSPEVQSNRSEQGETGEPDAARHLVSRDIGRDLGLFA